MFEVSWKSGHHCHQWMGTIPSPSVDLALVETIHKSVSLLATIHCKYILVMTYRPCFVYTFSTPLVYDPVLR
ncbi:hypothetical protein BDZ94DRAFT_1273835 [Collybia nuda]|uniref:Uncharacterized protein n=1 Tax=Collybia nuda TaxID=64659 RepID=A0A9P5XUQ3_9AGAR|nr:hypothetical protein BDZ94DRAFT_1273835 [Collybia nuda]